MRSEAIYIFISIITNTFYRMVVCEKNQHRKQVKDRREQKQYINERKRTKEWPIGDIQHSSSVARQGVYLSTLHTKNANSNTETSNHLYDTIVFTYPLSLLFMLTVKNLFKSKCHRICIRNVQLPGLNDHRILLPTR